MAEFWKRKCRVTFGKRGEEGKVIDSLHIDFSLNKNTGSEPNKGVINIFNMNIDSRGTLSQNDKLFLILDVSYADEPYHTIFAGDIIFATSIKEGADWVTKIEVGDGQRDLTRKTFQKSWKKGASTKAILREIFSSFEYITVDGFDRIKGRSLNGKLTVDGNLSQAIDKLLLQEGLTWTVQDEILRILSPYEVLDTNVTLLAPYSGLINTPFTQELTLPNYEKGEKTVKVSGIKFKSLIVPNILPTRAVRIESVATVGSFKCIKARYNGSNYGNDWYIECEATPFEV